MRLWLIRMDEELYHGGYDVVMGAVVRAESRRDAWELLRARQGLNDQDRQLYVIEPLRYWGYQGVILVDFHAG